MLTVTCELNDLEFERDWQKACDRVEDRLRVDEYAAAEAGIKVPYNRHPYTDRTYNLTMSMRVETALDGTAEMVAGMYYASFVNDKPRYEFMKRAITEAERQLNRLASATAERSGREFARGY